MLHGAMEGAIFGGLSAIEASRAANISPWTGEKYKDITLCLNSWEAKQNNH